MGDSISYRYLSDVEPKVVISLSLQTYNHVKYIATIHYDHPNWTDAFVSYYDKSSDDF